MTIRLIQGWRRRPRVTLGLDLGSHSMRLVALERSSSVVNCVHALHIALPENAVNGLELEGFETVVEVLSKQVDALGLRGHPVAMALPSHGVHELNWPAWDDKPDRWDEIQVYEHVQQRMQMPQEALSIDFGLAYESGFQQAWAVVARERVVQDRYDLAEQAGLKPTVLDVDRLALDRLLDAACQHSGAWPSIWLLWREGVLSAHVAWAPCVVVSRSAYVWNSDSLLEQSQQLLAGALADGDTKAIQQHAVSVRFTGLQQMKSPIMKTLQMEWPHMFELQTPCAAWIEEAGALEHCPVALGLALHPDMV
jgi:hypothetical protein